MPGLVTVNTPASSVSSSADATKINHIVNIMLAESRYTMQDDGCMKSLVRQYSLAPHEGRDYNIPKYGTVTAYDLTEGVDMVQGQQITDSKVTITPGETGVQIILSDKSAKAVRDDLVRVSGKLMGDAMVRKLDSDLLGLFPSFTVLFGGDGTTLYPGYVLAANARLRGKSEPAPGDLSCVLRPEQYHTLAKDIANFGGTTGKMSTTPTNGLTDTILKNYWVNSFGNADLFIDNNIARDASNNASGCLFSKEAIIYLKVSEASTEQERNASLRATEVNMVAEYGFGKYNDDWAIEMRFASTDPTS